MLPRFSAWLLLACLLVAGCSGGSGESIVSIPPGKGADSPTAAVDELVRAINSADFAEASRYAMPDQAALASLAEGAGFDEVATALREGDQEVAANFWAGFAQGAGNFLSGSVSVTADGSVSRDGVDYEVIEIQPPSAETRTMYVTESDGYRIDLFASFGAGLADKMIGPVERLLVTQTEDARLILARLQGIVPSLLVAASQGQTPEDTSQQILSLVEVITRVG